MNECRKYYCGPNVISQVSKDIDMDICSCKVGKMRKIRIFWGYIGLDLKEWVLQSQINHRILPWVTEWMNMSLNDMGMTEEKHTW